jgi:hypothetical protein
MSLILSQVPAYAEPTVMLGLSLNFGGGDTKFGVTSKLLSDDEIDKTVGAVGLTYFFDDRSVGFDAGLGYTLDGGAVTLTYDFTNGSPQLSAGVANTKEPVIHTVC